MKSVWIRVPDLVVLTRNVLLPIMLHYVTVYWAIQVILSVDVHRSNVSFWNARFIIALDSING